MSNCRTCKYLFNNTAVDDHCYHCGEDNNYEEDEWLAKHDREIYNKALDDCIKSMREESCAWEYAIAFIESCKLEEFNN